MGSSKVTGTKLRTGLPLDMSSTIQRWPSWSSPSCKWQRETRVWCTTTASSRQRKARQQQQRQHQQQRRSLCSSNSSSSSISKLLTTPTWLATPLNLLAILELLLLMEPLRSRMLHRMLHILPNTNEHHFYINTRRGFLFLAMYAVGLYRICAILSQISSTTPCCMNRNVDLVHSWWILYIATAEAITFLLADLPQKHTI